MRKIIFFLFLFVMLLDLAQALNQDDVYKLLNEKGKQIVSFKLNFKQTVINGKDENRSGGQIFYKSPNKFKVLYNDPDVEYISNGLKMWVYDHQKKQVLVKPLLDKEDFFGREILNFFKFDENLTKKYKIISYWEEEKVYCFVFTEISTGYKIEIFVDKKGCYPKKIIWNKDYIKFIIDINTVKFGLKLDDEEFEFQFQDNNEIKKMEI